jgi:site-specific recombinase XerD
MFLRNGGNAFALQKMLGHEDMSMTRRYVNLTSQDLQDAHRSASPLNSLVAMKKERVRLTGKGI